MKKSEIFALVAGGLGFVVDVLALAALFGPARPEDGFPGGGSLPRVWIGVLLVYGWFVVAWVLAQWRIMATADAKRRERERIKSWSSSVQRPEPHHIAMISVLVVGLLLLPISLMLGHDFLEGPKDAGELMFEYVIRLIFYCVLVMGAIGAAMFIAVLGALAILNDDEVMH